MSHATVVLHITPSFARGVQSGLPQVPPRRFAEAAIPKPNGDATESVSSIGPQEAAETSMAAETGSETRDQPLSSNTDSQET